MSLFSRKSRQPPESEDSVRELLTGKGASAADADELIGLLRGRLSPSEMVGWLTEGEHAHPVPDPDSVAEWGFALMWTPINAVAEGKTDLVLRSARFYASGEPDPLAPRD